jgi:type II secretory pathway pseudopilin PulG
MSMVELLVAMLLAGLLLAAGGYGMSAYLHSDADQRSVQQLTAAVQQAELVAQRDRRRSFAPGDFDAGTLETVDGAATADGQLSVAVSADGLDAALATVTTRGRCVTAAVVFGQSPSADADGDRDVVAGDCDADDVLAGM